MTLVVPDGEIVPDESRAFIETECLRVARLERGCEHLRAVAIARIESSNGEPNWEVLGFDPELSSAVRTQAIEAIERIRSQYELARFIKPPPKRR